MTKRTHLTIWMIAGAALAGALAVGFLRESVASRPNPPGEDPVALVQAALNALAEDQLALNAGTQSIVRAAAVYVEQGRVHGPEATYVLAIQYQREMNVRGAEQLFRQAIASAPEWSWPYAGLGTLLSRNAFGREEEAVEMLQKAIEVEPNWSKPHNSLAVLYRAMGRMEDAEAEALAALEMDPDDLSVRNNYANLMVTLGRFPEAEEHYLASIELNPDHPKPYYNLACLYTFMRDYDKALGHLEAALNLAPVLRAEAAVDPDLIPLLENRPEFKELVYGGENPPPLAQ